MDKFDKSLPIILNRTLDAIIPLFRKAFKEHGISEQQWRILRVLSEKGQSTSADLSKKTLLPKPSMVGIVDRMIKKDLVTRKRSSEDRRIVLISLTKKGHSFHDALIPKVDDIYAQIMKRCDSDDWHNMISSLQSIIENTPKK